MNKYGIRQELDFEGRHYISYILERVSKEYAEKRINEEMESCKRTLEHVNKTIKLILFTYDENYCTKDIYTRSVQELL